MSPTYALSSWFFARALGLIYVVAFVSLAVQAKGLWGERGILPIGGLFKAVEKETSVERYVHFPSLFWFDSSDKVIVGAAWVGAVAALLAVFGFAQGWMFLFCFLIYLSFVTAGQEFMGFQWDALLCEVGFLALFAVSWNFSWQLTTVTEPHPWLRYVFYLVLFKLMFLSGVVKLLSGDQSWRDMTAMTYHYWTQPLPNPLSPFMHALPNWFHKIETAMTFVIELALPFLIFWPRARAWAAVGFAALSVLILLTGNYTFFNWLTLALCIWLLNDDFWEVLARFLPFHIHTQAPPNYLPWLEMGLLGALTILSVIFSTRWLFPDSWNYTLSPLLRYAQTFHISNSYGLFANMTKDRPEIIIEGSDDGVQWKEYEFRFKPGGLYRRSPQVAPHQPRLDWQMWFAALGRFEQNRWLQSLFLRVFENQPEVMQFFVWNPFENRAPRFLRARLYQYEFESPEEILENGKWWKRELINEYSPTFKNPLMNSSN